jgi:peptidoglycan hydrolase CwlO-like protein
MTDQELEAVRALIETLEEQIEKLPTDSELRPALLKDRARLIEGLGERRPLGPVA